MQKFTSSFQAALDKGQYEPRVLVDLYELYDPAYVPDPVNGFEPADALETFASETITWNGIAYRRELAKTGRGDILKSMTEKTNQVTLNFSNVSRYMATLAQSQTIEGMFLVIRAVDPSVTDDSAVEFVGKCEKPSDIDKQTFTLPARQDFGNINVTLPPRHFTAQDPEGRLPSDPLYEGINFIAQSGSVTYPTVVPSTSFFGRLFGRRRTASATAQSSSVDGTPYGEPLPEVFGRCQMALIPILWKDHGQHIGALWAACNGPIAAIENPTVRTPGWGPLINSFATPPAPPRIHLGLAGTANVISLQFPAAGYFSHTAYVDAATVGSTFEQIDNPPEVTAIIRGRTVPLPDSSGNYTLEGWTDNPVHILRFLLTDPAFVNIDPAFMEDSVFVAAAQYCDAPLIDESNDQLIRVVSADIPEAGVTFSRYRSTGLYTPDYFGYYHLGTVIDAPEIVDGPYDSFDLSDPFTFVSQKLLRKRFTANFPITAEVRAVDLIYKVLMIVAKLFLRINKRGKYEPHVEKPADATFLRSATAVGATSLPILDVTPWKTGPELLTGRILLGTTLITSEVRNVTAAQYSTSGNSITLTVSKTGGVTISASGATLSGGSTTVQASGTITIGGTPAAGDTISAVIDGFTVQYILDANDTVNTAAAMLAGYINATTRLAKYISATWSSASPTVITIKCLHGALTLDSQLLQIHTGPVADPSSAPTIAASSGALAAGVYKVAYANVGTLGQTNITPIASITLTANQQIDVSSLPAFPAGITSRNFYISEEADSTRLKYVTNRTNISNFSINSLPLPNASPSPTYNKTAEELIRVAMSFTTNSQDIYPVWPASTLVLLNSLWLTTEPNGHVYKVTTQGVTGTTEPTWPTSAGSTVTSGAAVFTEYQSTVLQQTGNNRANIVKDGYKWPLGSTQSSVNQIKIPYRSAKDDFALIPYRVNDPVHQAQVKKVYPLEIDGSAIDSFHQMFRIANWQLAKNREGDWFNSIGTGPQGLVLEEGDVICASDDSGGLVNIPTRIEELRIHPNHDVTISQARKYSTNMFADDVAADPIPIASTLRRAVTVDSIAVFIDTIAIRDSEAQVPGFKVAVSHDLSVEGDWRGWSLYGDYGDGYKFLKSGDVAATIGTATTTLNPNWNEGIFDTANSVTVQFDFASNSPFSDRTETELRANPYRNLFLIGDEYVQAGTIFDHGSRLFTFRNLLRDVFGTFGVGTAHSSSESVVYMDGAETFVEIDKSYLNVAYNYKVVTTNQDVADASPISVTITGQNIRSRKMSDALAVRDASNDWRIEAHANPYAFESDPHCFVGFWVDGDRSDPVNDLKLTLPMVTGTSQAALLAGSGGSGPYNEDSESFGTTTHTDKNNAVNTGGAPTYVTTITAIEEEFQRFDFEMTLTGTSALAVPDSFGSSYLVALHQRADALAPYVTPDELDCPLSVEWFVPLGYPAGMVREIIRSYGVTLVTRDGVDPGSNPYTIVGNEVSDYLLDAGTGVHGPRYTFLKNGSELAVYRDYKPAGGNRHLAKISIGNQDLGPLRLSAQLPAPVIDNIYLRNVMFGGAIGFSTVLAARDQVAAFGSVQSELFMRFYQMSRYSEVGAGFPYDVTITAARFLLLEGGDYFLLEGGDKLLLE